MFFKMGNDDPEPPGLGDYTSFFIKDTLVVWHYDRLELNDCSIDLRGNESYQEVKKIARKYLQAS